MASSLERHQWYVFVCVLKADVVITFHCSASCIKANYPACTHAVTNLPIIAGTLCGHCNATRLTVCWHDSICNDSESVDTRSTVAFLVTYAGCV